MLKFFIKGGNISKIINFDSGNDFELFLRENTCGKIIGEGGEGKCILSCDGKNLYKQITEVDRDGMPIVDYNVNEIITTADFDLSCYILPQELYVLRDKLLGYKMKYIRGNDLFKLKNISELYEDRTIINFDALLESYYMMQKETEILSSEKIRIYDLIFNVMFVKNHLYGIDTCGYKRVLDDVSKDNDIILKLAIKEIFDMWLMDEKDVLEQTRLDLYEEDNMEKYVRKLSRIIN